MLFGKSNFKKKYFSLNPAL